MDTKRCLGGSAQDEATLGRTAGGSAGVGEDAAGSEGTGSSSLPPWNHPVMRPAAIDEP